MKKKPTTGKKAAGNKPAPAKKKSSVKAVATKRPAVKSAKTKRTTAKKTSSKPVAAKRKPVAKRKAVKKVIKQVAKNKPAAKAKKKPAPQRAAAKKAPSLKQALLAFGHPDSVSPETKALIDQGHMIDHELKAAEARKQDKRAIARSEHIHQFGSRA